MSWQNVLMWRRGTVPSPSTVLWGPSKSSPPFKIVFILWTNVLTHFVFSLLLLLFFFLRVLFFIFRVVWMLSPSTSSLTPKWAMLECSVRFVYRDWRGVSVSVLRKLSEHCAEVMVSIVSRNSLLFFCKIVTKSSVWRWSWGNVCD